MNEENAMAMRPHSTELKQCLECHRLVTPRDLAAATASLMVVRPLGTEPQRFYVLCPWCVGHTGSFPETN